MTSARATKIDLSATPYYHCMTRCVRRSYLCGQDAETGKNYSHRKEWLITRMKSLANVFAIHICAYAVMSNHYHLVLFVNEAQANSWSDEEIKERWSTLFPNDANRFEMLSLSEEATRQKLDSWRERLMSISWFMRCLNENIARLSNEEDACTGRFWEGRFKSQALLDEGALLSAMAYVDLNPIRAKIATTPETSHFTSIYERIKIAIAQIQKTHSKPIKKLSALSHQELIAKQCDKAKQPKQLVPFANGKQEGSTIDFRLSEYLQLVDYTGRILREDKPGAILKELSPILSRLNLKPQGWLTMVKGLEHQFFYAIGDVTSLQQFNQNRYRRLKGLKVAKNCYLNAA